MKQAVNPNTQVIISAFAVPKNIFILFKKGAFIKNESANPMIQDRAPINTYLYKNTFLMSLCAIPIAFNIDNSL